LKNGAVAAVSVIEEDSIDHTDEFEIIEVVWNGRSDKFYWNNARHPPPFKIKMSLLDALDSFKENGLAGLSQEVIWEITEL
jgi:hypothetical protein